MKLLVLPDIHGRDFWIEPCSNVKDYDKVIFLGDYHDPYPYQVSRDSSRYNLRDDLLPFILENKDKVVCLIGNHDYQYLTKNPVSRFDAYHAEEITKYLKQMPLQMTYQIDGYLFSHAGVLPKWLSQHNLTLNQINSLAIENPAFMDISPIRGGESAVGSCIWGDIREYDANYHYADIYQIFGHTQMRGPYITTDYACLDCSQAFVVDTELKTITPYSTLK